MTGLIALLIVLYLVAAVINMTLSFAACAQREQAGAMEFGWILGSASWWGAGIAGMLMAPTLETKIFWQHFQNIGVFVLPVSWLFFTLNYTHRWRSDRRDWRMWAVSAPVLVGLAGALTNDWHQLYYTDPQIEPLVGALTYTPGPIFWISLIYVQCVAMTGLAAVVWSLKRSPAFFRRYSRLLLGAALVVLLVNMAWVGGIFPVDLTPIVVAAFGLFMAGVFNRQLIFGITPIARTRVVAAMHEGIIVVSSGGLVAGVNPAAERLLGIRERQALGTPAAAAFSRYPVLTNGSAREERLLLTVEQNGIPRVLEVRELPIRPRAGAPLGWLIHLRDVTAREEAARQRLLLSLEQRRLELLSTFVSGAAHEFRTPLSVIRSSLYLAARTTDPAYRANQHAKIVDQVARMNRLLDQVQTMVKLDAGMPLEQREVDVNALVQSTVADSARQLGSRVVRLNLAGGLPPVRGDARLLGRALDELLLNAALYSPSERPIVVETDCVEFQVRLTVRDQGEGMTPEVRQHLFERLFRGDPARSTPGFGLGLAIVRQVVDAHQGSIEVDSRPGAGTTVSLRLPASPIPAAAGAVAEPVLAR